jgi:glycosyltransferase involved in cell wall biosynthesis
VAELSAVGWSLVGVLPIIFNPERLTVRPDPKILKSWQTGVNLLFVGRIAPNKCFEDLILTFHYLKQTRCPNARLFLVGSSRGMEPYLAFLEALINRLALTDVFFAGHVSAAQWAAYYQVASLYLSLSEHEGFGVPLLESMYFGVPIVAYKATAVPETLGGSGVLVKTKDHAAIAELIAEILGDESLRNQLIAGQKARLQAFLPEVVGQQLQALLGQLSIGSS